jgi:hypothetical protein
MGELNLSGINSEGLSKYLTFSMLIENPSLKLSFVLNYNPSISKGFTTFLTSEYLSGPINLFV